MSRLAEWRLERAIRRSTGAADRFDGFGHLRHRPAFVVMGDPRDADPTWSAEAARVDAGRPFGCTALALRLAGLALLMAALLAAAVVGTAYFAVR